MSTDNLLAEMLQEALEGVVGKFVFVLTLVNENVGLEKCFLTCFFLESIHIYPAFSVFCFILIDSFQRNKNINDYFLIATPPMLFPTLFSLLNKS